LFDSQNRLVPMLLVLERIHKEDTIGIVFYCHVTFQAFVDVVRCPPAGLSFGSRMVRLDVETPITHLSADQQERLLTSLCTA
jgi:hypothetical protein